jgi:hypothetical protein
LSWLESIDRSWLNLGLSLGSSAQHCVRIWNLARFEKKIKEAISRNISKK